MKQLIAAFSNPKKGKENVILIEKTLSEDGSIVKNFEYIEDPQFNYWVSKEEKEIYETSVPIDEVRKINCKYSKLHQSIAKATDNMDAYHNAGGNWRDLNQLHFNKNVHLSDIHILDYLYYEFYQKNVPNAKSAAIPLHKAYFDIEVNTRGYDGFPEPDEAPCPVNLLSYVDAPSKTIKIYALYDDTNASQKEFIEKNKGNCTNLWTDSNNWWVHDTLHEYFTEEDNPKNSMEHFSLYWFKEESSLIKKFYSDYHKTKADFLGGWNVLFDCLTIKRRLEKFNIDPLTVMCPPEFPEEAKRINIKEDNYSANLDDKNDTIDITGWGNTVDLRYFFLAKRKGQGKRDSTKLGDVLLEELGEGNGKAELDDNIKDAVYTNFENFLLYSGLDSYRLLQLENKNLDIDLMHMMSSLLYTRHSKVMRKNISIRNLAAHYFRTQGRILSNNQNKFIEHETVKFEGAFVANPLLLNNVGLKINGHASNSIFDEVVDFDFTGLYPAVISTFQIGDACLIGKILFEEGDYLDRHYGELLNERNFITMGNKIFNLPTFSDILENLDDILVGDAE